MHVNAKWHTHTNAHGCLLSPESFIAKRLISKISESHIEDIPYHSKFVQNRRIIVQNNLALTPFSYYVNLNWIYIINTITKMIIYNWIWMIFGLETPRKSIHPHFEGNMCNLNTLIWSVAPRGEATHDNHPSRSALCLSTRQENQRNNSNVLRKKDMTFMLQAKCPEFS